MARGQETVEALLAQIQATKAPSVPSIALLQSIPALQRAELMEILVTSDQGGAASLWRYAGSSTATDAKNCLVVTPSDGVGRWLLVPGHVVLTLPFTFATADAAVLWTAPTGCKFRPRDAWWEIGVSLTGGASSAIGVHASPAGWTTKGDILGGATGDVAATLVSSATRMVGTVGTKMTAHTNDRLVMIAGDTFIFDQITSAFTAGSGNVRILGDLITNPGA
jgi:hypothetical protein